MKNALLLLIHRPHLHRSSRQAPEEFTYLYYEQAGNLAYVQSHITACKVLDDYNPFNYQSWYSDKSLDKPAYCSQVCSVMTDGKLDISCISCEDVPLVSVCRRGSGNGTGGALM